MSADAVIIGAFPLAPNQSPTPLAEFADVYVNNAGRAPFHQPEQQLRACAEGLKRFAFIETVRELS